MVSIEIIEKRFDMNITFTKEIESYNPNIILLLQKLKKMDTDISSGINEIKVEKIKDLKYSYFFDTNDGRNFNQVITLDNIEDSNPNISSSLIDKFSLSERFLNVELRSIILILILFFDLTMFEVNFK